MANSKEEKIVFWGQEDDVRLTHTDMDDAIESILDGVGDIKDLPETIEVCGYVHRMPDLKKEAFIVLERMLEGLDETYGDPDGYTKATDCMIDAAEKFAKAIIDEHKVWACQLVKRETINVQAWIKENRPDWIEAANGEKALTDGM